MIVRFGAVGSVLACLIVCCGVGMGSADAEVWSRPVKIGPDWLVGISCPTTRLCVAVEAAGGIVYSTHPSPQASAWHRVVVDNTPGPGDAPPVFRGVSCPTNRFCAAVNSLGNVAVSQDPGGTASGGSPSWSLTQIDDSGPTPNYPYGSLSDIACPSADACVATAADGDVITSSDPTGGSGAWTATHIESDAAYESCTAEGPDCQAALLNVSCASVALCEASDEAGFVFKSDDPADGASWKQVQQDYGDGGGDAFTGLACPAITLCVGATEDGLAASWDPSVQAKPYDQQSRNVNLGGSPWGAWCSSARLCFVAIGHRTFESTNAGSSHPRWSPDRTPSNFSGIACPTPKICFAVDHAGSVLVGTPTPSGSVVRAALNRLLESAAVSGVIKAIMHGHSRLISASFPAPGRFTVRVTATVPATRGHRALTVVLGKATATLNQAGRSEIHLVGARTARGRRRLSGTVRIREHATFTPDEHTATSRTRSFLITARG